MPAGNFKERVMAHDEGLAQLLRDDLAEVPGVSERRMFGGLCFFLNGNMLCGVDASGAMFRVGKESEAKALEIEGASPWRLTGRKMGGLVDVSGEALEDDGKRSLWLGLALDFVKPMPSK